MADGRLMRVIGDVEGAHTFPEAKSTVIMNPGAVMNHVLQNGGGFGDPLDREAESVVVDVASGLVSAEAAFSIYGVRVRDGAADAAETDVQRDAIRRTRLADLQNADGDYTPRDLPVEYRWGEILALVRDGDRLLVQVTDSGAILGPLGDNWRDVCPWRVMSQAELGPHVTVDDRLEVRQYIDPLSGRSLLVDCQRRGEAPVCDFRLERT